MADIEKKKVSELDEETNPSGFWIFGYKEYDNGAKLSVRVLFDKLIEHITLLATNLQLERRISLTMENAEQNMFFGEETTIYKVENDNVGKFEISIDGGSTFIELAADGSAVDYIIPARTKATFRVEQSGIDTEKCIYIYAKAKKQ